MTLTQKANTSPRDIRESDFPYEGTTEEKMRFLLRYAVLAPSSHNSQPWKFSVRNNRITIAVDNDRWLKVSDTDRRELYISAGCALENLLITAEHFGYGHAVDYFPGGDTDVAATVILNADATAEKTRDAALFDMIPRRSTSHKRYDGRPVPEPVMTRLHGCCFEEGFCLFPTSEADNEDELRSRLNDLIIQADAVQLNDKSYKEELGSCIGQGNFGAPWPVAKVTQLVVSHMDISKGQIKKDSGMLLSAPSLVALGASADDRKAQVIAGQIFERVALTAALLGLAVHPMSQFLEVPEIKAELTSLLPGENVFPLHTFRLGYAEPEKGHTPRRTPSLE
jgi:nitroreductase